MFQTDPLGKKPQNHSIRIRFLVANLSVLLITLVGVGASQWLIAKHYEQKRVRAGQLSAAFAVEKTLGERVQRASALGESLVQNPKMVESVQLMENTGDETPLRTLIHPLISRFVYEVGVVDSKGRVLFYSGDASWNPPSDILDLEQKTRDEMGRSSTQVVTRKNRIEFHLLFPLWSGKALAGFLDVITYIDNQLADQIAMATGNQVAFLSQDETRPVVSSHPDLLHPKSEGRFTLIHGKKHLEYREKILVGDQSLALLLFTDVTPLIAGRQAAFFTMFLVVGGIVILAWVIATLVSRPVSDSLVSLAEKSDVIAKGDYSARIHNPTTIKEINRICQSFNDMAEATQKAVLQLEAANRRLKELDQLKSGFLSSVSHELRTPLTSVLGFAKLIKKDFVKFFEPFSDNNPTRHKKADRIKENLDVILKEGDRLTRLINDVLDLAKIEAGRMEYREEEFPAEEFITQAAQAVSGHFAQNSQVRLVIDVPDHLGIIRADRDRLVQVMINLLGNAAKFTDRGQVRVEASVSEGRLSVRVRDTGRGIPDSDLEKIFDRFQQIQKGDTLGHKPQPVGTGLGLAISRQIVEHHGGKIWAESSVGQGSLFSFFLPTLPESGRTSPSVLLVEADPMRREVLARFWAEAGYRVLDDGEPSVWPDLASAAWQASGPEAKRNETLRLKALSAQLPFVFTLLDAGPENGAERFRRFRLGSSVQMGVIRDVGSWLGITDSGRPASCLALTPATGNPWPEPQGICPGPLRRVPYDQAPSVIDEGFAGIVLIPTPLAGRIDLLKLGLNQRIRPVVFPVPSLKSDEERAEVLT